MKKLFVLAASALLLSACAKENIKPNEPTDQNEERPLLEIGLNATKTALGTEAAGKFPIVWSEGDEIAVIDNMGVEGKQNISVYRIKEGIGTAQGLFEHVSGDAFPKVINDVVYPASVVDPKSTFLSETLITDVTKLVPKVQNQVYTKDSFDPKYAVMYFHRNTSSEPIKLSPLSTIVCIPIKGFGDNDIVTSVRWQHMDRRTVDVTLNCHEGGVKLSKNQATNFYLSVPATAAGKDTFNSIAYVYLKNGAVQVKTPRNRNRFEAGTLHRFPEWQLSKKAEWSILGIGSERTASTFNQMPYGPGQYMIDDNNISWWEFRRELNSKKTGPQMAGSHTVILDLGEKHTIKGIGIKAKETEDKTGPKYGITYTNSKGEVVDIYGTQSYNPPHTYHVAFLNNKPSQEEINNFTKNKTWPDGFITKVTMTGNNNDTAFNDIKECYGDNMQNWWKKDLKSPVNARYVLIHFEKAWNNEGKKTAANMMKVAELDIY